MAGVLEMLLQSHEGSIEPIPALPKEWSAGSFSGLVACGNFKVSAEWNNRRLMIWKTVGAPSPEALLKTPEDYEALFTECSPLTHVTPDDPSVFASFDAGTPAPPERDGIHHAEFGSILKERCDALGLECTIGFHDALDRDDALDVFILDRFHTAHMGR